MIGEIHKAAFRNAGLALSETDILAYNQYLQLHRTEDSYSAHEKNEILRLYKIIKEQLKNVHPEYIPGFTLGIARRFPFIDFEGQSA